MPIDVAALATTIVSTILLPYVKKGADKLAEGLGEKLGEASAQHVTGTMGKIWERIKAIFSSDDDKQALAQFEKRPDAAKGLVEEILKEKLAQDGKLAQELTEILARPGPAGQGTGAIIGNAAIAAIIDARGADFSGTQGVTITGVNVGELPKPGKDPQ